MYIHTETCYGETRTFEYERLEDAIRDACHTLLWTVNLDTGDNDTTDSYITGPDDLHVDFAMIQDIHAKEPRDPKQWEKYWGYVARTLEQR